jgi:hypothetical protein
MRRIRFIKNYYQKIYYYQNYQNSFNKQLTQQLKTKPNTQPNTQEYKSKIIAGVMTTLLACSETLPFISEIESNGVLDFFSKLFRDKKLN